VRIDIVTIFPEYLAPLSLSLVGKARETGLVDIAVHDLRDWTHDRHRSVDDAPYGGGPGMVMAPEPWGAALDAIAATGAGSVPHLLVTSPSGRPLTQAWAHELAREPWLVLACGRYEGIDARVAQDASARMPVDEVSVADVVLAGGEAAALVVVEAVVRLVPGVLGNPDSLTEESHSDGLLEYPVYTRPAQWRDHPVPDVLLSGDHARVAAWRRRQSLKRTSARRPDLLAGRPMAALSGEDRTVLTELGWAVDDDGRLRPPPPAVAH
jgi:tRNA (guanine37-N1)-methyltransferase